MQNDIQIMLQDSLPDSQVIVQSNDGRHFDAIVVTDAFIDKRAIERQKIIYAIIGPHITNGQIHALSLKTYTHQEWQEKCGN